MHTNKSYFIFLLFLSSFYLFSNLSFAQVPKLNDQPVIISIESYLVQERETEEGQVQEWFERVNEAKPNDTIEVRLVVRSEAEEALAAATLLIAMPIPNGMNYIDNSATPSSNLVMLEFSKDKSLFAENLFKTVTVDSVEKRLPVSSEEYQALRWTVLDDFEPDEELTLFYRLKVLEPENETNKESSN